MKFDVLMLMASLLYIVSAKDYNVCKNDDECKAFSIDLGLVCGYLVAVDSDYKTSEQDFCVPKSTCGVTVSMGGESFNVYCGFKAWLVRYRGLWITVLILGCIGCCIGSYFCGFLNNCLKKMGIKKTR